MKRIEKAEIDKKFEPQGHKIKFTKENFEGLVQLHLAAQHVADMGYEASKSKLEDVANNLEKLNHTCYMYRNTKFKYPLAREWGCSTCADTGMVELAPDMEKDIRPGTKIPCPSKCKQY